MNSSGRTPAGPGKTPRPHHRSRSFHSLILWGLTGEAKRPCKDHNRTTIRTGLSFRGHGGGQGDSGGGAGGREILARKKIRTWLSWTNSPVNKATADTRSHVENGAILLLGATTRTRRLNITAHAPRAQVAVLEPLDESVLRQLFATPRRYRKRTGKYTSQLAGDRRLPSRASGGVARVVLNASIWPSTLRPTRRSPVVDFDTRISPFCANPFTMTGGRGTTVNIISALKKRSRSDPDAGSIGSPECLKGARTRSSWQAHYPMARRTSLAIPLRSRSHRRLSAYHFLGSPEGELALRAGCRVSLPAPQSNALYTAFGKARDAAKIPVTPACPRT